MQKKDYYRNVFSEKDHNQLLDSCQYIDKSGAKFMVSYDDVLYIKNLYKEYHINKIKTKYVGSNPDIRNEVKTELVITNYKLEKQEELF